MKIINEIVDFAIDSLLERLAGSRFKWIALAAIAEIGYRDGKRGYPSEEHGVSVPIYGWVEMAGQPAPIEQSTDLTPPVAKPAGKVVSLLDWRRWLGKP